MPTLEDLKRKPNRAISVLPAACMITRIIPAITSTIPKSHAPSAIILRIGAASLMCSAAPACKSRLISNSSCVHRRSAGRAASSFNLFINFVSTTTMVAAPKKIAAIPTLEESNFCPKNEILVCPDEWNATRTIPIPASSTPTINVPTAITVKSGRASLTCIADCFFIRLMIPLRRHHYTPSSKRVIRKLAASSPRSSFWPGRAFPGPLKAAGDLRTMGTGQNRFAFIP